MNKSILIINGSPRKNGLTYSLAKIFQDKIQSLNDNENNKQMQKIDIEIMHLTDFRVKHCSACDNCLRKPYLCPLDENDDFKIISEKMLKASAIIIATPTYFSNVSGLVKDLIDRSRPLKMAKYKLKNKLFSVIVTSGLRAGGLNVVQNSLIQYALIQGMIVIGALGHPVLMANFPTETSQKMELTDFRKSTDISGVAKANCEALAERFWKILQDDFSFD
ncbi:MAG: flavodoxin family protein [Candidatus Lokiarchaeota archaeon]|nr:flavodoxin family protein [Candidatus Harpocratesius repetitus]